MNGSGSSDPGPPVAVSLDTETGVQTVTPAASTAAAARGSIGVRRGASRLRREGLLACAALAVGSMLLVGMAALQSAADLPPGTLSRDPLAHAGVDALSGLQSNAGALLWFGAASVAVFVAIASWRSTRPADLLWLGLLAALLAVDDLLMLHEALLPRFFGLGETIIIAGYGAAAASILWLHRLVLATRTGVMTLLAGFGCLALSVVVDAFQHRWDSPWRIFVEDGTKLLGIVAWSIYLVGSAAAVVRGEPPWKLGRQPASGRPSAAAQPGRMQPGIASRRDAGHPGDQLPCPDAAPFGTSNQPGSPEQPRLVAQRSVRGSGDR